MGEPVDFLAQRYLAAVTELHALAEIVGKVEALIDAARKVSPSPTMTVYVADLEAAFGRDAPRPHKLGQEATPDVIPGRPGVVI